MSVCTGRFRKDIDLFRTHHKPIYSDLLSVCTGRFRKVWTRLVAGAGTARTTRDKTREDVWGDEAITEATPLEGRIHTRILVLNHRGHTTAPVMVRKEG